MTKMIVLERGVLRVWGLGFARVRVPGSRKGIRYGGLWVWVYLGVPTG